MVKKRYYYLRDALGSVVAVTNDQGTVVRRHVYSDPYGKDVSNDTIVSGAPSNPWRFAGEYFDSETNLYKIGERYLDPALARWTQKDPMMQAFSPREVNGYSYVGGDPINQTDPSGMASISLNVDVQIPYTSASVGASVEVDDDFDVDVSVSAGGGIGGAASLLFHPTGEADGQGGISGSGCYSPTIFGPSGCVASDGFGVGWGSQSNIQYQQPID